MSPERAAYVAGYTLKKLTKPDDVRLGQRHPEFARMSRRPALGDQFMRQLGEWLRTRRGERYLLDSGDVPLAFRTYGRTWPVSPRHQRMLRQLAGLPEKRSDVKMAEPGRWLPPELPSADELAGRRQKEVQYGEKEKRRASARPYQRV